MGNIHPNGIIKHPEGPLESVMDEMAKSKAFIGIGSGLSWLSWALGTKTVLISGFSEDWAEMKDIQVGQVIRKEGPNSHLSKQGTPTMGGIAIILATLAGYFFSKLANSSGITPNLSIISSLNASISEFWSLTNAPKSVTLVTIPLISIPTIKSLIVFK